MGSSLMLHPEDVDRVMALPGWGIFQRTATVMARKMEESFEIVTREGNMRGMKGDYLCIGSVEQEMWPVKASVFEQTYEHVVVGNG